VQSYVAAPDPSSTSSIFNTLVATPSTPAATNVDLLTQIILEAEKTFVCGSDMKKDLKAKLKADPSLKEKIRDIDAPSLRYKDDCFTSYDANRITGTHFIAAAGPSHHSFPNFINQTLFNEKISVKKIIALGDVFGYEADVFQDFFDYFSGCRKNFTVEQYQIEIKRITGDACESNYQIYPRGIIKSTLCIRDTENLFADIRQLDLTLIPLEDMASINLDTTFAGDTISSTLPQERRAILWQLFQDAQNENIVIHCAEGVGRTGHLILTFEIMKEYDRIFSSEKPDLIAAEIHKILNRIRENRPPLVSTKKQFARAIRNAHILHCYGLEKSLAKNAEEQSAHSSSCNTALDNNEMTNQRFVR